MPCPTKDAQLVQLERRKQRYSELYQEGQQVLDRFKPCNINLETGECRAGCKISEGLCCKGCKHLGPNGCTVEALMCKLWLCSDAAIACPDAAKDLQAVMRAANAEHMPMGARASKEEDFVYEARENSWSIHHWEAAYGQQ